MFNSQEALAEIWSEFLFSYSFFLVRIVVVAIDTKEISAVYLQTPLDDHLSVNCRQNIEVKDKEKGIIRISRSCAR